MDRRTFIKGSAATGIVSTIGLQKAKARSKPKSPGNKLSIALIGTGLRGQSHLDLLLRRDDCEVTAFCDVDERMIQSTLKIYENHKAPAGKLYTGSDYAWKEMLDKENCDAVIISTPWEWHTEMCIYAMERNKYVGTEVSGAFSVEECWKMVHIHEKTGSHLYFMENVCFRRDLMAVLQMVRQNVFGEVIHFECGYQHDLRGVKFNDGVTPYDSGVKFGEKAYSEARWRTIHSVHRNGDLYPTHGIGPVAQFINLNRGNRLVSLSSFASKARGLHQYIVNHPKGGTHHPNTKQEFKLGDKVTTMLNTAAGETIVMHHDTNLPRPYSLGFRVQGTKGLWMEVNKSIHIEGISPDHRWEEAKAWLDKYDHPLWANNEQKAIGAGHGGMDYFLINSFVEQAKKNESPVFDVYDAATWRALTPLSEESIAKGGALMTIPDFTSGKWLHRKNNFARNDRY